MTWRVRAMMESALQTPLLVAGAVASDPVPEATWKHLMALKRGGANFVELLLPFSEPTYHGPVIERAFKRALQEDTRLKSVCAQIAEFRRRSKKTPLILTTYYNRVISATEEEFVSSIAQAGADALHVVDLPWSESEELRGLLEQHDLVYIPEVAATVSEETWQAMELAHGGSAPVLWTGHFGGETIEADHTLLQARQSLKVVASMQVSDPEEAQAVVKDFDGLWISSATVWLIEGGRGDEVEGRLTQFVQGIREGLDASVNETSKTP